MLSGWIAVADHILRYPITEVINGPNGIRDKLHSPFAKDSHVEQMFWSPFH